MTSHYIILEVFLGQPLDTSFGLLQFYGHGSRLVCEVVTKLGQEKGGGFCADIL
jgi:hypothetical protein